ncbi:FecR family protein [Thalassospira lucentensis]|uniref:FecR family protein n=1 Tax=Thalassospira lucentensis TaxID=168935 RepID=UPI003AA877BD
MSEETYPATASAWIARLNEEPENAVLRHHHDAWLLASKGNRDDWEETLRVWQMLEMTIPVHGDAWKHHIADTFVRSRKTGAPERKIHPAVRAKGSGGVAPVRRSFGHRNMSIGLSALALCACLLVFVLPGWMIGIGADYTSETGKIQTVALPDGSQMQLAPQSAVSVSFDGPDRLVTLLRGEAFFKVEPMQNRPFTVTAGDVKTTVLGTAFDVRRSRFGVNVAVEHGHVQVADMLMSDPIELRAGDHVHVDPGHVMAQQTVSPSLIAPWRNGRLSAKDQSFAEMVETLDRYFDGWILITDDALAAAPLTGFYDLTDPKAALKVMADAQGAEVQEISQWILMVSPR